jgi:hypothetical protein
MVSKERSEIKANINVHSFWKLMIMIMISLGTKVVFILDYTVVSSRSHSQK